MEAIRFESLANTNGFGLRLRSAEEGGLHEVAAARQEVQQPIPGCAAAAEPVAHFEDLGLVAVQPPVAACGKASDADTNN